MNDFFLNMALDHFEFDEPTKARIKAAIPKAAYLFKLAKNNKTVANELIEVGEIIMSQIAKKESA